MIGGKLTTFRAFAEQVADKLLARLGSAAWCRRAKGHIPGRKDIPMARPRSGSGSGAWQPPTGLRPNGWPRVGRYGTEAEPFAAAGTAWRMPLLALPGYTVGKSAYRRMRTGAAPVGPGAAPHVITLLGQANETALADWRRSSVTCSDGTRSAAKRNRCGVERGQGAEIERTVAEMTSTERVMTVLRRGEPDRIPHFEWIIDKKVRHALCPGASTEEFTVRMGLDAMLTGPGFQGRADRPQPLQATNGAIVVEKGEEQHSTVVQAVIRTMADPGKYQPPDAFAPYRFDSLKKLVARYKGKYAIGVHLNDVLSIPRNLMGFQELMMAFCVEPELVARLVEMSVDLNIQLAGEAARCGADFVFTGDDYSSGQAPFMAPDAFRKLLYPGLKRVVKRVPRPRVARDQTHRRQHHAADGHDPRRGLRLPGPDRSAGRHGHGLMKQKYGQAIALKGNVNCATTLVMRNGQRGSAGDAGRDSGGGRRRRPDRVLQQQHSLSVAPLNYLAMLSTIRAYGRYPIRLDFDASGAGEAFS